jgi:hypothetical protein
LQKANFLSDPVFRIGYRETASKHRIRMHAPPTDMSVGFVPSPD